MTKGAVNKKTGKCFTLSLPSDFPRQYLRAVAHIVRLSSLFVMKSEMQSFCKKLSAFALCLEHWDYHTHPHIHPVEFENLQETNFTELQSVQALHPPALIRHEPIRYEADTLLDPNLGSHVLQQPVSPSVHSEVLRPPSQVFAELQRPLSNSCVMGL